MSEARTRLRRRLGFIVEGIDAGRYREPEDAADMILAVVCSDYPEHRADLLAMLDICPAAAPSGEQ